MTATDNGRPLGFCTVCFRVRWLGVVTKVEKNEQGEYVEGVCSQCVREREEGATA